MCTDWMPVGVPPRTLRNSSVSRTLAGDSSSSDFTPIPTRGKFLCVVAAGCGSALKLASGPSFYPPKPGRTAIACAHVLINPVVRRRYGIVDVEIRDEDVVTKMRAREVSPGPERERLWDIAVEVFPNYGDYQKRTQRLIPLFLAEPV